MNELDYETLSNDICDIALKAGDAILDVYNSDDFDVQLKSDNSP